MSEAQGADGPVHRPPSSDPSPPGDGAVSIFSISRDFKTPLAAAIALGNELEVAELLEKRGAAASCFTKGYSSSSLVCTLPQARQPPSKHVDFAPPLTGVSQSLHDLLDSSLERYIIDLHEKSKEPPAPAALAASAAAAALKVAVLGPFNPLPAKLSKGDRVTPGPSWATSGHTTQASKRGTKGAEGTVSKLLKSNRFVVYWDEDPDKPHVVHYNNEAGGVMDVQLVDLATSTTRIPPSAFQVGDLIQKSPLKGGMYWVEKCPVRKQTFTTNLLTGSKKWSDSKEEETDDKDSDSDDGKASADAPPGGASSPPPSKDPAQDPALAEKIPVLSGICVVIRDPKDDRGEQGGMYHVANLQNGTKIVLPSSDVLQRNRPLHKKAKYLYADGSQRGNEVEDKGLLNSCPTNVTPNGHTLDKMNGMCGKCGMHGPSSQSSDIWCKACRICAVCVAKGHGPCTSPSFGPFASMNSLHKMKSGGGSTPNCLNCRNPYNSSTTSQHSCSACEWCAVCCARGAGCTGSMPVVAPLPAKQSSPAAVVYSIGQRVMLEGSFAANGGDGWCLGKVKDGVVGVVLSAPPAQKSATGKISEQRNIVVAPELSASARSSFRFRASWLQPAPPTRKREFKVGDRVQLDSENFDVSVCATIGKCLGAPKDCRWGIVTALLGQTRDGVQRNIQVHVPHEMRFSTESDGGLRAISVSLYPSYALVPAVRAAVLSANDRDNMLRVCAPLVARGIEVSRLLRERGIGALESFDALNAAHGNPEGSLISEWESSRDLSWPDACHECLAVNSSAESRHSAASCPKRSNAAVVTPASPREWTWKCEVCKFANGASSSRCLPCRTKGKDWECGFCSAANGVNKRRCIICAREQPALVGADQAAIESELPLPPSLSLEHKPNEDGAMPGIQCAACNFRLVSVKDLVIYAFVPGSAGHDRFLTVDPPRIDDLKLLLGPSENPKCPSCSTSLAGKPLTIQQKKFFSFAANGLLYTSGKTTLPLCVEGNGFILPPGGAVSPSPTAEVSYAAKASGGSGEGGLYPSLQCIGKSEFMARLTNPAFKKRGGAVGTMPPPNGSTAGGGKGKPKIGILSQNVSFGADVKRAETDGFTKISGDGTSFTFPDGPIYLFSEKSITNDSSTSLEWTFKNVGGNSLYCGYVNCKDLPPSKRGIVSSSQQPSSCQVYKIANSNTAISARLDAASGKFTVKVLDKEVHSESVNLSSGHFKLAIMGYNGSQITELKGSAKVTATEHYFDEVSVARICTSCGKCSSRVCRSTPLNAKGGAMVQVQGNLLFCGKELSGDNYSGGVGKKYMTCTPGPGRIPCSDCTLTLQTRLGGLCICGKIAPPVCVGCGECADCCVSTSICPGRTFATLGNPAHAGIAGKRAQDYSDIKREKKLAKATKAKMRNSNGQAPIVSETYESISEEEEEGTEKESPRDAVGAPRVPVSHASEEDYNEDKLQEKHSSLLMRIPTPQAPSSMSRTDTISLLNSAVLEPLESISALIKNVDKEGSSAAHYVAKIGLQKSVDALRRAGSDFFLTNRNEETPQGILDGVDASNPLARTIHHTCSKLDLFPSNQASLRQLRLAVFNPKLDFDPSSNSTELMDVDEALQDSRLEDAIEWSRSSVESGIPHAEPYYALALLDDGFPIDLAAQQLSSYESKFEKGEHKSVAPLYYYARYYLWKKKCKLDPAYSRRKAARKDAQGMLSLSRLFPCVADKFLDPDQDKIDADIQSVLEGSAAEADAKRRSDGARGDDSDDDDDGDDDVTDPSSPASQWKMATRDHGAVSPAMNTLMETTGLKRIKQAAVSVFKDVLLTKLRAKRGLPVDSNITMNFLFVGNPGCGKTTVAVLIASIMCELGMRTKPDPVLTTASELLKLSSADLNDMIKQDAAGGVLFIDEAYLLQPSPPGQQPNKANEILDALLKESEDMRKTTSFILAGYKDKILNLLTYNDGFKSRFPLTFEFDDYTVPELRKILKGMIQQRHYRLEPKSAPEGKRSCGVNIAKIASERIGKQRGKPGFGNARDVRNFVDAAVKRNTERVGTMAFMKMELSDEVLTVLTRSDVLGEKPDLKNSPLLKELDAMIGLRRVKDAVRGLMSFQLQNYDAESAGLKVPAITLHRMFLGNPGTGKTTVAKLYGQILREFGLLSNGDFIGITANDLLGSAVGTSGEITKQKLKEAEGKVLLIDEAYVLDPSRGSGANYGGDVLDVLVEKIGGSAGLDMAIILAGYTEPMMAMLQHCNNPGLRSRFQPEEAIYFDDYTDEEMKKILLYMCAQRDLVVTPDVAREVVRLISTLRRLPDFANARLVENFIGRALQNKAKRLEDASKAHYAAKAQGLPASPLPDRRELLLTDFKPEDPDEKNVKLAFDSMYNNQHLRVFIEKLEATIKGALAEGKSPADLIASSHMVFMGPPGTGKTTVARMFGKLFKQLELLPSDKVVEVTAQNIQGQYVGHSKEKVLEAMKKARGGILFIDEAYGLVGNGGNYSNDVQQALVDNITSTEFKGNLLVIMAGYEKDPSGKGLDLPTMFKRANPGLDSRFNKVPLRFSPWTGEQAFECAEMEIKKLNKTITQDGLQRLRTSFERLAGLPKWASARDVFESILPKMESSRYIRISNEERARKTIADAAAAAAAAAGGAAPAKAEPAAAPARNRRLANAQAVETPPFTDQDVDEAFQLLLQSRGINSSAFKGGKGAGVAPIADEDEFEGEFGGDLKSVVMLSSVEEFEEVKCATERQNSTAVVMISRSSCPPCQMVKPKYIAASEGQDPRVDSNTRFFLVDCDEDGDLGQSLGIRAVPTFLFMADGDVVDFMQGGNERELFSRLGALAQHGRKISPPEQVPVMPPPQHIHTRKQVHKFEHEQRGAPDANEGEEDIDFWAALEKAIGQLGYTLDEVEKFLESKKFPQELIDLLMELTQCDDEDKIFRKCEPQIAPCLQKVKRLIKQAKESKSAEERKKQEKIQRIGKCVMGFDWLREGNGYRCAGGSHYLSDNEINAAPDE